MVDHIAQLEADAVAEREALAYDPLLHALWSEHFGSRDGYQPPAEVKAAEKAMDDLLDRTQDRPRTRDERRLLARYQRTIDAHHDELVTKHGTGNLRAKAWNLGWLLSTTRSSGTMPTTLKEKRATALTEAKNIVTAVKQAGRDLTRDEQAQLEALTAQIDQLDDQIARAEKSAELIGKLNGLPAPNPGADNPDARVGLFTAAEAKTLATAVARKERATVEVPLGSPQMKAAMTTTPLTLPAVGEQVTTAPEPRAVTPLRDLFTVQQITNPVVRWYDLANPAEAGVGIVAEGGQKPDAEMTYTPHTDDVVKIATSYSLTTELAHDAPFMVQAIQANVVRALLARENAYILDTLSGADGIRVATGAAADLIDLIATEVGASTALNGEAPTSIVLNPVDLASIRVAKATTSGAYYADPFADTATSLHGVPMMATPACPAGTVYVLTNGFGSFYQLENVTVTTGWVGDDFRYNRTSVVVEERVLAVVNQPTYVTQLTVEAA